VWVCAGLSASAQGLAMIGALLLAVARLELEALLALLADEVELIVTF